MRRMGWKWMPSVCATGRIKEKMSIAKKFEIEMFLHLEIFYLFIYLFFEVWIHGRKQDREEGFKKNETETRPEDMRK